MREATPLSIDCRNMKRIRELWDEVHVRDRDQNDLEQCPRSALLFSFPGQFYLLGGTVDGYLIICSRLHSS